MTVKKQSLSVTDLDSLESWVNSWTKSISDRQVIFLDGDMGVGKTQLVRFLSKALGCSEASSPTYSIHNRYVGKNRTIDHLDLYRIEGEDDLESTGLWDIFSQLEGLVVIEWAQKVNFSYIPNDWSKLFISIKFVKGQKNSRLIETS